MSTCCPEKNLLPDNTINDIEKIVDKKVLLVVAFDIDGNPTLLRPPSVDQKRQNVSKGNPLENKGVKVTSINSASYGAYEGSYCVYWTTDGVTYSFCV